jgi:hypothetical protein
LTEEGLPFILNIYFHFLLTLAKFSYMRRIIIGTVLSIIGFVSLAQNKDSLMIRRIADEILINGKAYDNLHHLTKQIGPTISRLPGNGQSRTMGFQNIAGKRGRSSMVAGVYGPALDQGREGRSGYHYFSINGQWSRQK